MRLKADCLGATLVQDSECLYWAGSAQGFGDAGLELELWEGEIDSIINELQITL